MQAMNNRVSLLMLPVWVCTLISFSSAFTFRKVLDEEEPALAGTDYIEIAVAVDIYHRDLHPPAHTAAVVDYMFDPFARLTRRGGGRGGGWWPGILIPVHAKRLLFAGIA